jgi:lycopene beta-cyclase
MRMRLPARPLGKPHSQGEYRPSKTHVYDYIIAGSGAAGFGLAYQMAMSRLRGKSILLVDRETKENNDRTWCFWTEKPTRLDHLVYHTWDRIEIAGDRFHEFYDIRPYQYKMIRGIDFYQGMQSALADVPGMEFRQARISGTGDTRDKEFAEVIIDDEPYAARYAFDSIFKPSDYYHGPDGYHYLKQHFKGWEIETRTNCFDPSTVTLFDFRTPQKGSMRFFYILPFTRRRALVEYTLFSADILKPHEYDRAIAEYIENVLQITQYRTESVETGVIPMTDRPFPRKISPHVMAIGTRGGLVKPSSGYAFSRIQNDAAAIIDSLVNYGNPFQVQAAPARYRLFDTVMLQVMYRQGGKMKDIFTRLFERNTPQEIFRFLDERAPLSDNIRLLSTLPTALFLNALIRVKFLRKV